MSWSNRVTHLTFEDPEQLLANPNNARFHPNRQRDVVRDGLNEVGWVDAVIVNDTTGNLLDGHMRIEEALTDGATRVPVLHVELDPDEEHLMLAMFDATGNLARYARIQALLDDLADKATVPTPTWDPDTDPVADDWDDGTEFRTLVAVYTRDRYDEIMSILDPQPGKDTAEKLWNLILQAGVTT